MENFASCAFSLLAINIARIANLILHNSHLRLHLFGAPRCFLRAQEKKSVISNFLIVIVSFFVALCSIVVFYDLFMKFMPLFPPHHTTIILLLDFQLMFVCTYFIIIIERLFVASSFSRCWHESVKNESNKWRSLCSSNQFQWNLNKIELALIWVSTLKHFFAVTRWKNAITSKYPATKQTKF